MFWLYLYFDIKINNNVAPQPTRHDEYPIAKLEAYGSRLRQKITISLRDYSLGKTQQILENLNV
jgi:hypothetical protein